MLGYWVALGVIAWTLVTGIYEKAALYDAFNETIYDSKSCVDRGLYPVLFCASRPASKMFYENLSIVCLSD